MLLCRSDRNLPKIQDRKEISSLFHKFLHFMLLAGGPTFVRARDFASFVAFYFCRLLFLSLLEFSRFMLSASGLTILQIWCANFAALRVEPQRNSKGSRFLSAVLLSRTDRNLLKIPDLKGISSPFQKFSHFMSPTGGLVFARA